MSDPVGGVVARLRAVEVVRDGRVILGPIDLEVGHRGHLVVLGPNGSGKTTLLRILSTYLHPTRGTVDLLGARFGRVDLRTLRGRVAVVSAGMLPLLHRSGRAAELVAAARHGALRPLGGVAPDPADVAAVEQAMARVGASHLRDRVCRTLSQGEWQRVQIARALVTDPELLLLDEPFVGLDLGGRESLVEDIARVMREPDGPTVVLVTHHVEEIPDAARAALLLREGTAVAAGPAEAVLTADTVSATFGLPVAIDVAAGRYRARLTR